ncbi:unnamed protein product [Schistocephalus solidus]|uniref:Uncharacterized protein n=1 Tax=Schistocephalus solidus TaxID=70667 RepID=A0A183TTY9_SCHSO|nr:unnamed protein product [Schistocephalus solidus]
MVFRTRAQKKEAVIVTATETLGTLPLPGSVRQVEAHQAIIDTLQQTGQTSHDVVPDVKGNTSVASLCLWPAASAEGVAGTHLLQLALLRESGLAETSNVHLVAHQFPSDKCHPHFQPVAPRIV